FSALMQSALLYHGDKKSVYVALADQDDTWHLDKLQRCLAVMLQAEASAPDTPVLVHSDLHVVDASGGEIAPSFIRYQGLDPTRTWFAAQLISNTVTGCTSLMNMALLKKALPVPAQAVMHDWWLSLVASAFGCLVFVPAALVEYRQHGRNTLGAREHKAASPGWQTFRKIFQIRQTAQAQQLFRQAALQAKAFDSVYAAELAMADRRIISDVLLLPQLGLWRQRLLFRKLRS
ncbi:MAG: hypothetical protein KKD00_11860, partial [Gammaproteobacteria bacterium]|nr:hypothetical protein [Gammaproteobacteria bacterium]